MPKKLLASFSLVTIQSFGETQAGVF